MSIVIISVTPAPTGTSGGALTTASILGAAGNAAATHGAATAKAAHSAPTAKAGHGKGSEQAQAFRKLLLAGLERGQPQSASEAARLAAAKAVGAKHAHAKTRTRKDPHGKNHGHSASAAVPGAAVPITTTSRPKTPSSAENTSAKIDATGHRRAPNDGAVAAQTKGDKPVQAAPIDPHAATHKAASATAKIAASGTALPPTASAHGQAPAAAPAAALLHPSGAPAHPATPAALKLDLPVAHAAWGAGLADHVAWMVNQSVQHAELHLNPPELGPLHVSLTLHNAQANAQFVAQHPGVRDALAAALPRLKQMLAGSGIALGNATVSADSSQGQPGTPRQGTQQPAPRDITPVTPLSTTALHLPRGMVDIFA